MAYGFNDDRSKCEVLPIANGGTGAATAAEARTNLNATSRRTLDGTSADGDILQNVPVGPITKNIGSYSAMDFDFALEKSGYIPIGVIGISIDASGGPSDLMVTNQYMNYTSNYKSLTVQVTNNSNATKRSVEVSAYVAYISESLLNK